MLLPPRGGGMAPWEASDGSERRDPSSAGSDDADGVGSSGRAGDGGFCGMRRVARCGPCAGRGRIRCELCAATGLANNWLLTPTGRGWGPRGYIPVGHPLWQKQPAKREPTATKRRTKDSRTKESALL